METAPGHARERRMSRTLLTDYFPRGVRSVDITDESGRLHTVYCAVDLVRVASGCSLVSAKGAAWRILREHLNAEDLSEADGFFEASFGAHQPPSLAADPLRSLELACLVPRCSFSRDLRLRVLESFLRTNVKVQEPPPCAPVPPSSARRANAPRWRRSLVCAALLAAFHAASLLSNLSWHARLRQEAAESPDR